MLIDILRSARIAGLRSHLGEVVGQAQWDGIISEDEHHRLLAVTANRHSHGPKRAARTFPLVGYLTCGKCGARLRSHVTRDGQRRRRRYVCVGGELGGCGGIQIKAEFVEDAVRDYVIGVVTDPDLRDQLLAAAPKPDDRAHTDAVAELRNIDLARQRLTDLAVDGTIDRAEVRRKNSELDEQAARLERQLADAPTATTVAQLPLTATELADAWVARGIDFQRMLINLLINSVAVGPATRMAPGRFDDARLTWDLRA